VTEFHGLAIVVINYGSSALLAQNLVTVAQDLPGARVVVVDNRTSGEESRRVGELCRAQHWQALLLDENTGFGGGINIAVATSLTSEIRYLMLLNPDATIDAASVQRLLDHVAAHPLDLVAPRIVTPTGKHWAAGADLLLEHGEMRSWLKRTGELDPVREQPWLSGACLMLSRELWARTGGFDDDYFLYWEDVDFSRRALDAGAELVVDPLATAVHDEGSTHRGDTTPRAKSPIYYYYNTRNRLLFAAKHLGLEDQRRWRRSAPAVGYQILLQGGRRQLTNPRRTLIPAVRGTIDGLRLMRQQRLRNL
jgi:N-acetylglucosaminyl-diphospho-decaprenol L-rhamnosyltransferase